MWADSDFADGALSALDTDEQRKKVLDGIHAGVIDNPREVFGYVLELAGFCERVK